MWHLVYLLAVAGRIDQVGLSVADDVAMHVRHAFTDQEDMRLLIKVLVTPTHDLCPCAYLAGVAPTPRYWPQNCTQFVYPSGHCHAADAQARDHPYGYRHTQGCEQDSRHKHQETPA